VRWDYEPGADGGTYPAPDGYPIRDLDRWREQLILPDLEAIDWKAITLGWTGQPVFLEEIDRSASLLVGIVEMGLFERSYLLLGMENALAAYVAQPEQMSELLGALADFKVSVIERLHAATRLDMVSYGDDWGTQYNLFVSPKAWRQVIKPHTRRIYETIKKLGLLIIQHSCGKISPIFADLVEMGADVWNPCQPCNDLAELKRLYGDQITFYGGIDSQFVLGKPGVTAAEVRAEVRRRIDDLAAGGGYIASPSHDVPYDPKLVLAMQDEIAIYGKACYART
jgi:uroporphyrinogen-III decarboxylase